VRESTGRELDEPDQSITIRQRKSLGFITIARTVFKLYPGRTVLGLSLFVGQAFLYNSMLFSAGDVLTTFFKTASGDVPYYLVAFAVGNFAGAVLLAPLFDSIGRKVMIAGTYILAGGLLLVTALLFKQNDLTATTLTACWCAVFFFASAGASAAYLTVSEVFPMETRALAIAFFYAVGTALGGIIGPLLFAKLIKTGSLTQAALGFALGGVLMIAAGIVEVFLGVDAERKSLEDIAMPLTAEDDSGRPGPGGGIPAPAVG
jgi:MFS family permease